MSKKNTSDGSAFGSLEDDFFSAGGWSDDPEPDAAEAEAARVAAEAARVEAERAEAARVEAARVEAERAEAARVEAERAEAARVEAERAEAARAAAAVEERPDPFRKRSGKEKSEARRAEEALLAAAEAAGRERAEAEAAAMAEMRRMEAARREREAAELRLSLNPAERTGPVTVEVDVMSEEMPKPPPVEPSEDLDAALVSEELSTGPARVALNPTTTLISDAAFLQHALADAPIEDAETQMEPALASVMESQPSPEPAAVIAPQQPAVSGEGSWTEAVALLRQEAERASGARRIVLCTAAAHFARTRLKLASDALALLDLAGVSMQTRGAGRGDAAYWLERARALEALGERAAAAAAYEALGAVLPGAAESEVEAARLHVATGADDAVTAALGRALVTGEDASALSLLVEVQRRRSDPALAATLQRLAALHAGPIACGLLVERATLLARTPEAREAWTAARAADPSNAAALAGLDAALRDAGDWSALAALYAAEAERVTTDATLPEAARGAEAAWWWARAARVLRAQLQDDAGATRCFEAALRAAPGASGLRHELQAHLAASGHGAALTAALNDEAASRTGTARALTLYRAARALEASDPAAACALYVEAADDVAAAPAAEAALRLMHAAGRWQDEIDFLARRAARLEDASLQVALWHRAGETAEGPLADLANARTCYEKVLALAPGYLPALEALERIYHRAGAWAELAAVYAQRAALAEQPSGAAMFHFRAGSVFEVRLNDAARAEAAYRAAFEAGPAFLPAVDAYARALEASANWAELGRVLRAAAGASGDGSDAVSLYYRAARVLADQAADAEGARQSLRAALELSPGFLPAVLLLKELAANAGDAAELLALEAVHADMGEGAARRHWRLLAAAEVARAAGQDAESYAEAVLAESPAPDLAAGALEVLEQSALLGGDAAALARIYARAGASVGAAGWVRLAEVAVEAGEPAELVTAVAGAAAAGGAAVPWRTLARCAEAAGRADTAAAALRAGGLTASTDAVRVGAADGVFGALAAADANPALAQAALRLRATPGEAALAQQVLARSAVNPGIRANHARVAATLFRVAGDAAASRAAWELAFEAQPGSRIAFEGLRGALVAEHDADALRAVYARLPVEQRAGLGEALEEAGDSAGAIAAYRAELESAPEPLPWSVRLERALAAADDWKGVFDVLTARAPSLSDALRAEASARCRWILAEKLAGSDEAWSFYQQLHAANPEDREVLEALARIAGARGETALAIRYLDELSKGAGSTADAARFQRRTADALEAAGDTAAARDAYARALDLNPNDAEALAGLRRIGEAAGDWAAVVQVLERSAALSSGRDRVERYAEVARIQEERVGNVAIAMDAWRKVLDLAPEDQEALRHLLALCERSREWTGFVEIGQALLPFVEGAERSALQSRIGTILLETLRREDDAVRLLDAAGTDADAAALLERIYTGRGDWDRAVDAMTRIARSGADVEVRTAALARAARMRLDMNRDRAAASQLYERLLELNPDHYEALRFRAEQLFEAGQFHAAATIYDKLEPEEAKRDVEDFDEQVDVGLFYFRSAEALRRSGRGPDAMARYERALQLNPTHLPSLEAVGPMYTEAGQWQRADKVFKQVLQLTGGHGNNEQLASVYANLGIVELNLGQPDKARKRFSKALELRPNEVLALRGLATVLFQANDWNNLLNIYNNIIYHTQEPSDVVDAYVAKGFVLDARLNLPDKAAQHYEKGLAFDGNQVVTLLRLAELALRRQDWPEASGLADRGLVLAPVGSLARASLLLVKAIALHAGSDEAGAADAWSEACAQDASVAAMLEGLGVDAADEAHARLRQRLQAALKFA